MRISFYLVPTNGRHSCGGVAECRAFNDSIQTIVVKGHDPLLFDSRDQEDVLVKDIHFPSLEIELRHFNFRRVAARKDEHHQDHLHKLPRLLPILLVPIFALRGAFECGLFYIVLRREK
nr:MAG TPA: hypothetical protein [Caudoviricetes sp.]